MTPSAERQELAPYERTNGSCVAANRRPRTPPVGTWSKTGVPRWPPQRQSPPPAAPRRMEAPRQARELPRGRLRLTGERASATSNSGSAVVRIERRNDSSSPSARVSAILRGVGSRQQRSPISPERITRPPGGHEPTGISSQSASIGIFPNRYGCVPIAPRPPEVHPDAVNLPPDRHRLSPLAVHTRARAAQWSFPPGASRARQAARASGAHVRGRPTPKLSICRPARAICSRRTRGAAPAIVPVARRSRRRPEAARARRPRPSGSTVDPVAARPRLPRADSAVRPSPRAAITQPFPVEQRAGRPPPTNRRLPPRSRRHSEHLAPT